MRMKTNILSMLLVFSSLCSDTLFAQDHIELNSIRVVERSMYRDVMIAEGDAYRCITFGMLSLTQSCIKKDDPDRMVLDYTKGMMIGFAFQSQPKNILILGLGGGILPRTIQENYPDVQIDSVEIDPAVVTVAERFFKYKTSQKSTITIEDARVFVRSKLRENKHYDMIFVDAFDKNYIPEHLLTTEFLQQLRCLLSSDGVLVANTFINPRLMPSENKTYAKVFNGLFELPFKIGNRILVATPQTVNIPSQQSIDLLAKKLEKFNIQMDDLKSIHVLRPTNEGVLLTDRFNPSNTLMLK